MFSYLERNFLFLSRLNGLSEFMSYQYFFLLFCLLFIQLDNNMHVGLFKKEHKIKCQAKTILCSEFIIIYTATCLFNKTYTSTISNTMILQRHFCLLDIIG